MKNQFADAMSKGTDADLQKMITAQPGDYQPEAVEAAKQEIEKRKIAWEELSKYTDEQILEILKSRNYPQFEVEAAGEEAKKRNLHFDFEKEKVETELNEVIEKLKSEVIKERYPALRFISGLYKILAWLVAIATVIVFFYMPSQGQMGIPFAIGALVGGVIIFVTLLATAEGIKV